MSREKDSAVVYELVTSKYKIAQRNRVAKMQFLNNALKSGVMKRRDSEPSFANTEKTEVQRFDISVPGTPVSSRYVASLTKKNYKTFDSDSENEDNTDDNDGAKDKASQYHSVLEASLKKFTDDMENLQHDDDSLSHDPLKKYFEESDRTKTYRRNFSEVVSEFPIQKKEPETIEKVERYFQESERMNSFKRDFSDVFQTYDPRNPSGREQFTELNRIGTPISSRLIATEKLSSAIENESKKDIKISSEIEIEIVENGKNSQVHLNSNGIKNDVTPIDSEAIGNGNALKIIEDDEVVVEKETEKEEAMTSSDEKIVEKPTYLKRSDSVSSVVSVPGTPISSRDLCVLRNQNYIDTDDSGSEDEEESVTYDSIEIKTLAQEFVHEIECLVQKTFDDDRQEIVLEELKKITIENVYSGEKEKLSAAEGESDEKLIIHEEQRDDSNPDGLVNKVEAYFEKSEKANTYTRTFSEVENFNEVSNEVKQKVENYFKESEEKKSLTRPFSQVFNYVKPKIDVEQLLKPGTPVSSTDLDCLKKKNKRNSVDSDPEVLRGQEALKKAQDALQIDKKEFIVDDYFKQSQERQTYQRSFSEVLDETNKSQKNKNPEIEKYFDESDAQNTFQRPFSQAIQSVAPRVDEILKEEEEPESKNLPLHYQRSSRASSISSNCSDLSESENQRKPKKHGKKYGIDKYFATSLYRTAYHRSNSRRTSRDGENNHEELKILEDEDVFGETDLLRQHTFQHDDETAVTRNTNDVNGNQTVQFWRDFLKPYNLNLQSEITITKDDLLNNRTLE